MRSVGFGPDFGPDSESQPPVEFPLTPGSRSLRPLRYCEIFQSLGKLGVPWIIRAYVMALQTFLKRLILGKKDESLLAANGEAAVIENLIFILLLQSYGSLSSIIADAKKASEDPDTISQHPPTQVGIIFRQGLVFGVLLMIPTTALCVSSPWIYRITDQPEEAARQSVIYFRYAFPAYFFDVLYRSEVRCIIGLEKPWSPVFGDLFEAVIDIALTYVFVMGTLGCPEMGLNGSGLAYSISAVMTFFAYSAYLSHRIDFNRYQFFHVDRHFISWKILKEMASTGLPLGFASSFESISQMIITLICGLSGSRALLGVQAALSYSLLITMPSDSLSETASVLIAAASNHTTCYKKIGNISTLICFVYASLAYLLLLLFIKPVAGLFVDPAHTADFQSVQLFLCIQGLIEVIDSVKISSVNALTGCFDTHFSFMMILIFIFGLNSLSALAAHFIFHQPAEMVFSLQLAGYVFAAANIYFRWHRHEDSTPTGGIFSFFSNSVSTMRERFFSRHTPPVPRPQEMMQLESPRILGITDGSNSC